MRAVLKVALGSAQCFLLLSFPCPLQAMNRKPADPATSKGTRPHRPSSQSIILESVRKRKKLAGALRTKKDGYDDTAFTLSKNLHNLIYVYYVL
jgi:hypothetical protein